MIVFNYCSINTPAIAEDIIPIAKKQTTLKVNSINFDNSDSIIFLGTSGSDNNSEIKITKQALTDPDRIFFDIENSKGIQRKGIILKILTALKQTCNHPAQFLDIKNPKISESGKMELLFL